MVCAIALATASTMAQQTAAQQSAGGGLVAVRALMDDARYEDAITAVRAYLGQPGLRARDYDAGLEMLAVAQLALRDERGATQTLATLYGRDPGHRLSDPDPSPVVQAAFARARAAGGEASAVQVEASDPVDARPAEVAVRFPSGVELVDEVRLAYRTRGAAEFDRVVMSIAPEQGVARARIPRDDSIAGQYVVEYFVQAFAPSQTVLASLGSAESPLTLTIARRGVQIIDTGEGAGAAAGSGPVDSGSGSVFGKWWFWTLVVGAIAGGVTAYVLLGPPSQGPSDGTLGSTVLR